MTTGSALPGYKTINVSSNSREWYLERQGTSFVPTQTARLDLVDVITTEIACTVDTAKALLAADLVRIVDHLEIPKMVGRNVMPGSYGIAYRCEFAKRAEDLDEPTMVDADTLEPFPLQEDETWRVKLLDGSVWASIVDSNGGYPIFEESHKQPKYLSTRGGTAATLFIPRAVNPGSYNSEALYITEGEKKAIHLVERGFAAISIPGVANWSYKPDRAREAARSGQTHASLDPYLMEHIVASGAKSVVICFDSPDVYDNSSVIKQLAALAVEVMPYVNNIGYLLLPKAPLGRKMGVDDWLLSDTSKKLEDYIVRPDDMKDVLEAVDERAEALLRILYERERAKRQRGVLNKASPEASLKDVVKKLRVENESQVKDLVETVIDSNLNHNLPRLWALLDDQFRYAHQGSGTIYRLEAVGKLTTYKILPDSEVNPLQQSIYAWARENVDQPLTSRQVAELERLWKLRQTAFDHSIILPCDLPSNPNHVFHALPSPKAGSMPAWEEFLSRVDRDTFLTFVGSVIDITNRERRILWLYGHGNDGKSVVAQVLGRAFGSASTKLPEYIDPLNKHLTSTLEGCRLAYIPETKQATLIQTGLIKSISGYDDLTIDKKGKEPYQVTNYVRLIVCGNVKPQISSGRSDISRLLPIHVTPGLGAEVVDHTWPEKLRTELPQLFHAAIKAYDQAGRKVHISPAVYEWLAEAADTGESKIASIFEQQFKLDPEGFLSSNRVASVIREKKLNSTEEQQLRQYIDSQPGVRSARRRNDGHYRRGYEGIRQFDPHTDAPEPIQVVLSHFALESAANTNTTSSVPLRTADTKLKS